VIRFIPRKFKNIESNDIVNFEEIVESSNISVILGEPASGKTYQLKEYAKKEFYYFIELINIEDEDKMEENISLILLDSIDEALTDYKNPKKLQNKLTKFIKNNTDKKFIITCRYLEWKEYFEKELKELDNELKIYEIIALSKKEIDSLLKEEDRKDFWKFIDDNHLESLLKNIMIIFHLVENFRSYDNNSNYVNIYESIVKEYITKIGEDREEEDTNRSLEDLVLIASSLATYMMLNRLSSISSSNLKKVASECYKIDDKPIIADDLTAILKTALFEKRGDDFSFFHKSIQEYLTAYFIDYKKLDSKTIKKIFAHKLRFYEEFEEIIIYLTNIQPHLFDNFVDFDPFIFRRHSSLTKEQQEKLFLAIIDKLKNEKWMIWGKGYFFKNSSLVKFDRLDNLEELVKKYIIIDKINYTLYTYFIELLEHNYSNKLENMIFEIFQNIKEDKKFLEYLNDYFIPNLNYNKRLLKFIIENDLITKEIGMLKNEMFFILYEAIDFKNLIPILNNLGINASIYYPNILQKLSSTDLVILFNDLKKKDIQLNDNYVVYLLLNIFNNYEKISKQISIKEIDDFIYRNLKTIQFTYAQGTLKEYKNVNLKNLLINNGKTTLSFQSLQFIMGIENLIREDREPLAKSKNNKLKEESFIVKDIELKLQQWMENQELNFSDEFYIIIRDKIKNIDLKDLSDFIEKLKLIYSEKYQILKDDIKEVVLYFIALDKDNYQYLKGFWIENIEENHYYLRYMIQADTNKTINDFRRLIIKENRKILVYKEDKEFDIFTIEFEYRNKIKYLLSNMGYIRIPKRQHNFVAKLNNVSEENLRFLIVSYYKCFNEYQHQSKGYRLDEYAVMSNTISKLWEHLESTVKYIILLEELSLNTIKRLSIQSRYSLEKVYNLQLKNREYPNSYYKDILDNGLLPISSPLDLFEVVKEIWDKDIRTWIESEGAYKFVSELAKKEKNTNAEDFIQKSIEAKIESGFYKRGYKEKTFIIKREEQLIDDKRLDFTISYPPFGSIVIELKLAHNAEVKFKQNNEAMKKAEEYIPKLKQYIKGSKSNFALFVIFNVEEDTNQKSFNEQIDKLKELYKEHNDIDIIGLNCVK